MKITIKSWEGISNTPGLEKVTEGFKMGGTYFNEVTMKDFCGKTIEVRPLKDDPQGYLYYGRSFYWSEWMLQDKISNFKSLYEKLQSR